MPNEPNGDRPAGGEDGQQRISLHVDERGLRTNYSNAFRVHGNPEELIVDFGMNMVNPAGDDSAQREIVFIATDRVILNYYSAKRLAITLGQHVRQYEDEFGELETDPNKRRRASD